MLDGRLPPEQILSFNKKQTWSAILREAACRAVSAIPAILMFSEMMKESVKVISTNSQIVTNVPEIKNWSTCYNLKTKKCSIKKKISFTISRYFRRIRPS